ILENTLFYPGTNTVDYSNCSITENTRVSYPLKNVKNAKLPSTGGIPKNIFFLTCDANGVLPPISKLTVGQAMYHFISGYTAKVAGTEAGITEPVTVFSACFGAPFMPLHPTKYAELLGEKMVKHGVNIWLINTGWSGGAYGTGSRIKLKYTRAMITAALNGELDDVEYFKQPVFGLKIPLQVPNVPDEILDPRNTWSDKNGYDIQAEKLAIKFNDNFEEFKEFANDEIMEGSPNVAQLI
ncbi:phosphoenolpyruvate carboxykinase (ATP), partial [Reichenbachiella sp.]